MIFSGADLIRNSGQQQARAERVLEPVTAIAPAENGKSLDDQTNGALFRFARFLHDEKGKRSRPKAVLKRSGGHPYLATFAALDRELSKGHTLDIHV